MTSPLLSAILPHHDASRAQLCKKTVSNFVRQHYLPFELVVINGTEEPIITNTDIYAQEYKDDGCFVKEIFVKGKPNAAAMRNEGIKQAAGEWIVAVDNDDWFHPQRFLYQMAHRREGSPCLLQQQLRVDVSPLVDLMSGDLAANSFKPLLYMYKQDTGVASTMVFPKYKKESTELWLYDESLNSGEHEELLSRLCDGVSPVICNNNHTRLVNGLGWPLLSVAMFHGSNELQFNQFFEGLPEPFDKDMAPIELNTQDISQLKTMLRSYNFNVS